MIRFFVSAAAGALLLAGCSGSNDLRKTYPVAGTITIDGAPAEAGVLVLLHPQFTETDKYPIHPRGATADGGTFKITTYNADDGAPEGEYVATVEWPQRVGMSPHYTGDLFGGLFANLDVNKTKPEFKVNVSKQGAQLTLTFTLTSQQKSALEAAKKKAAGGGSGFNMKGD